MGYVADPNVQLVASYDGQTPDPRGYALEMRAYEESRDFAHIDRIMRERDSVCG